MNRRELNNLIKEELEAAVKGHPSYLEEAEDMEAGDMEGGEEGEEELMDYLKGCYEKLKAHFDGEEGGEEKTEEEEDEMEEGESDTFITISMKAVTGNSGATLRIDMEGNVLQADGDLTALKSHIGEIYRTALLEC